MRIEHWPQQLQAAVPVLERINQAGFEVYFVGGCVRDTLLQRPLHDVDLATSAYPQEIKQIFPQTIDTGIEHGTVTVIYQKKAYEITTFRTESGYQDYRRPDKVEFVRSLKEDLKRRDFTINALAMNAQGEIIDLFAGMADLQQRQIRAVGVAADRFHEDALRMLRAVRFQAQLNFTIEKQTLAGIKTNAALLSHIATERIREEFIKLMEGCNRQAGLISLYQTQLYRFCPGLATYDFPKILQFAAGQITDEATVWSFLAYLGQLKRAQVRPFLRQWKVANNNIKLAQAAIELLNNYQESNWQLYIAGQAATAIAAQVLRLTCQQELAEQLIEQYQDLPLKSPQQLAINGQQIMQVLNLSPGPQIGQYLKQIQQAIVAGQLVNDYPTIVNYLKNNNLSDR
ncbi:CCA tRNA nucleotidyltransferase [Bombilactobacillus mellis]|uniref:CCA tRNA nucleotidyltransferase n=1 Tax=Bombilactobacillus mellis TaxID=1218508 RepID=UPI00157FC82D|nr:CCA tRNA nucleotidyltransferase [Bombilactobacillus mellis]MBI0107253.1 CCA tRNA nucleotidyltransferase [Lactobacillus sp. W8086]MBI0108718.1 CCA tRNA nucleotidyltransferase [Lactobacillus sp. W8085]MBI0111935.1 CCA tRNA nucleotidyltransferase [Lactobacillus sp. W8088]MBI0115651.1 CCA tRNA nucleotidyltransferase [Lactobacillus sp. W8087]MBI0119375.1 CCA tRNA nucleotidyltransferase [Lactobacillus sp. W8089]MBI0131341.1 CCA tRNA nucleotidyltransferase [Lactobacillus sp. W8090]